MTKSRLISLSIIGGILFSLAWTEFIPGLIIFIAFVPLLIVEEHLYSDRKYNTPVLMFLYAYFQFAILNLCTSWWLYKVSMFGPMSTVLMNSFFMAIPFWLFHITKRKLGPNLGYLSFIIYWMAFEHLHTNWDFSNPYLSLGNGIIKEISLIQWYEFTGVAGGSLWIILINLFIFKIFVSFRKNKSVKKESKKLLALLLLIIIPLLESIIIFNTYKEKDDPKEIVIVQPNIDPYFEKFDIMTIDQQLQKMLDLAADKADISTDYIVGPETSLPNYVFERHIKNDFQTIKLKNFLTNYPQTNFVLGINTRKLYTQGEKISSTAHKTEDNQYFDLYNTAMQIDKEGHIQLYHKSQLIMGTEKIPYSNLLKFLEKFSINLGGMGGSYGKQKERSVFYDKEQTTGIGPVICWESVYGEYITDYVKNGANYIFVITNDGWWGNTPGYKIHLRFSQLRAIENRRSIARSANTGISCFINQKGEIIKSTEWWTATAIKANINANAKMTFYTIHGDYISRICDLIAGILILLTFIRPIIKNNN
ncbi:apolipoprotein N-acyltransferase [Bacteroidota bacterium]